MWRLISRSEPLALTTKADEERGRAGRRSCQEAPGGGRSSAGPGPDRCGGEGASLVAGSGVAVMLGGAALGLCLEIDLLWTQAGCRGRW